MQNFSREDLQIDFPCDFPIKVVGLSKDDFEQQIMAIAQKHDSQFSAASITRRASRTDKYLSLTLAITAVSREQLDGIYRDLKACEAVMWAL